MQDRGSGAAGPGSEPRGPTLARTPLRAEARPGGKGGGWGRGRPGLCAAHQVVLLVAHLGGVSPHAVDGQQQVQEGEGRVQPQQVVPGRGRGAAGQERTQTPPASRCDFSPWDRAPLRPRVFWH